MPAEAAEQILKDGDPAAALAKLQDEVRAHPNDAKLRVFLFQLLCIVGQWERALNQLSVASQLDPDASAMAQTYENAVRCEAIRASVFGGTKSPLIFGEPDRWLALLIESLLAAGHGEPARSGELRALAFEEAPASSGDADGKRFEWISDADSRIGPVLEAVINGRYYWVPFSRLARIELEPPSDLRDLVWTAARLQFANGGESVALIPTRYAGSETTADGAILLGRKTVWEEIAADTHRGLGQRILATDVDELPLLEIRTISLDDAGTAASDADHA